MFIRKLFKTTGADDDCSLVGSDDRVGHLNHFGPRGREFERSNLQKFKCSGFAWVGGGGGMLKFRVDWRITSFLSSILVGINVPCFDWIRTVTRSFSE